MKIRECVWFGLCSVKVGWVISVCMVVSVGLLVVFGCMVCSENYLLMMSVLLVKCV